ncbi:hypothetical protein SANTM175S_08814 [Streptomyces antimycoticus]
MPRTTSTGWLAGAVGCADGVEELDERVLVRLVRAEGERLLELIHDHHRTGGGGRLAVRPRRDGLAHRPREPGSAGLPRLGAGLPRLRFGRRGDDVREFGDPAGQLGERVGARHELQHPPLAQRGHQAGVQQGEDFPAPEAPTSTTRPPVSSAAHSCVTRASVSCSRPNDRASC